MSVIELTESLNVTEVGKKHAQTINEILAILRKRDCKTAIEALAVLSYCISYTLARFKIPKESWFQIQEATTKALSEVFNFID